LKNLFCLSIFCLLLAPRIVIADTITSEERARDARLEQKVTFTQNPVYVGELLDALSKQSGVVIEARDEDHAADERIAVYLNDVRLGDALDAVWSFLSRKGAGYDWSQETVSVTGTAASKAVYKYRFIRTGSARDYVVGVRKQIQDEYESEVDALLAMRGADKEKRAALARDNPAADFLWKDKGIREGIGALADSLSPDQIKQVLRSEREIDLPLDKASPSARAMARGSVAEERELNPSMTFADPTFIHFRTSWGATSVAPTLSIGFNDARGYAGGTPLATVWSKRLGDDWKLSGDRDICDAAVADRPIDTANAVAPNQYSGSQGALAANLAALSRGAGVSSIGGALPTNIGFSMAGLPRAGQSVRQYVAALRENGVFHTKWRGNILLISLISAPLRLGDPHVPWSVVKGLRAEKAHAPDGLVPAATVFRLAHDLDAEQLALLGETEADWGFTENLLPWQTFWATLHRRPDLAEKALSPDGLAIADLPVALRNLVRGGEPDAATSPVALPPYADATHVAVTVRDQAGRNPRDPDYRSRDVDVLVWRADGKKKNVRGFGYENHRALPSAPAATQAKPTGR